MLMKDSRAWELYTYVSFAVSMVLMIGGILYLPLDLWMTGYLLMGLFFVVGNTVGLSKMLRDRHEQASLHHRIDEAKTEKLLADYKPAA